MALGLSPRLAQNAVWWSPQEMTDWLRGKDIIGGLLRANLHLAQYVAQVRPNSNASDGMSSPCIKSPLSLMPQTSRMVSASFRDRSSI